MPLRDAMCALPVAMGRWAPAPWPRVLMYHRVDATCAPSGMNIHPQRLHEHIRLLRARGAKFVFVDELLTRVQAGETHLVALSFDDGWQDNAILGELLAKEDAYATIYLSPMMDQGQFMDRATIHDLVAGKRIRMGAHTMHHVNLLKVDEATAHREMAQSKDWVEQATGMACNSFAYPFGRFSSMHVKMVQVLGFTSAVTTRKAIVKNPAEKPLEIPRISTDGRAGDIALRVSLGRGRLRY